MEEVKEVTTNIDEIEVVEGIEDEQTTFNEDGLDVLVEEGVVENVFNENE